MTNYELGIFLRPLFAIAIIILVVKPIAFLIKKVLPTGKVKDALFKQRWP